MSTFTVTVKPDMRKVAYKLRTFNKKSLDQVRFRLVQGANNIRNIMILSMQNTPKTGRKYYRGNGKWHIASSPGNPPAIDRGQLVRSITMREGLDEIEVGVTSGAPYGKLLEKGVPKNNLLPRPFLMPAVDSEVPKIERRIVNDLLRFKL